MRAGLRSTMVLAAVLCAGSALGFGGAVRAYPEVIDLPRGFQPEGIAIAPTDTFFVGSIPTGAIYRGSLRSGTGAVLVKGGSGRAAIGLAVDGGRRLFVAGGPTGKAFVYDGRSGKTLGTFRLARGSTFVNDVVVTKTAAWFTDSFNAVLYRLPIDRNGRLGPQSAIRPVPLSGDISYQDGFNANGIDATPDGRKLVIVQSNTGLLFTVAPGTGVTRRIALRGGTIDGFGDGLLLDGRTLYVVENANRIAVVQLSPDLSEGRVASVLTDSDLDVPTTADMLGLRLYAVNARFGTPAGPQTAYQIVQLRKSPS
jgi:sugar lactone lactonase YvrE